MAAWFGNSLDDNRDLVLADAFAITPGAGQVGLCYDTNAATVRIDDGNAAYLIVGHELLDVTNPSTQPFAKRSKAVSAYGSALSEC